MTIWAIFNNNSSSTNSSNNMSSDRYNTSWVTVRTFANTAPDTTNSVPPDGDFVSINFIDGIKSLQVFAKDLVITNAPSSVVVGVWVKVGTATPYLLGTFGATVGENKATVIGGAGFSSLSPILMDLLQKNANIKVACRVIVDTTRVSYTIDTNAKSATQTKALGANTGFLNTLCTTNSNSAGSPPSIGGSISAYDPITDAVTIENTNFIPKELLRLPWGNTPPNYFPPLGLSGKIICSEINRSTGTITIRGAGYDFRLLSNRIVRLRLSSIFSPISVFPSVDNVPLSNNVSYYLLNVAGDIGNQTAQLSLNGVTPLTFTSQGTGWIYIFPYRDIDGVSINDSNQLVIDDNIIDIQNDWVNQPVFVSTAGVAANILHTRHGFSANDQVRIGGGVAPGGCVLGDLFFVIPVNADNYKLSAVPNGLPIAFTSAGTAVTMQKVGSATITAVTVTPGTPSVISFGATTTTTVPHFMGAFQRFTLAGGTRPGAAYTYTDLFVAVTALTANSFQCNQLYGMPSVAFENRGTSVTLTAMLQYGKMLIERAFVYVGSNGDSDSTFTIKDSDNNDLSITGLSTATTTIEPINAPVITSGSIQVRPIGDV